MPAMVNKGSAYSLSLLSVCRRGCLALLACLACHGALAADKFLEPERAFRVSARFASGDQIEVRFDVEPGYYLYREQFRFSADGATLGPANIPRGDLRFDENFGKQVETHVGNLRLSLPVSGVTAAAVQLVVVSQGCAEAGLCYPPMTSTLRLPVDLRSAADRPAAGPTAGLGPTGERTQTSPTTVAAMAVAAVLGVLAGLLFMRRRWRARTHRAKPDAAPRRPPP